MTDRSTPAAQPPANGPGRAAALLFLLAVAAASGWPGAARADGGRVGPAAALDRGPTQLTSAPPPAPPAGFGRPRQAFVSLGSDSLLSGMWASGFQTTVHAALEAAGGYVFADHLYARLALDTRVDLLPRAAQDVGDTCAFGLALTPGVGGIWWLHEKVLVAPRIGVGVGRMWRSIAFSGHRSTVDVQVAVPFVVDIVDHVSVFAEPSYRQLVVNHESFPDASRWAGLGGSLAVSVGAIAYF